MNPPIIDYRIIPEPRRHLFSVQMTVEGDHPDGVQLYLPNWIAGSYMLRDFARHIVSLRAFDGFGKKVKLSPLNQHAWQSAGFDLHLMVEYEVFAHDASVRTAFLDTDGGFFNATSLCLCALTHEHEPHGLTVLPPTNITNWQLATTLARAADTAPRGFGEYHARDYDELADHPVRIGALTWITFHAHGTPHEMAIAGILPQINSPLLARDVQRICEAQIALFGQPAPFERYLFLVDARAVGYGGLEHRDSSALLCTREGLPTNQDNDSARRKAYTDFLGLISHEYFHSWNVKRIKPAAFVPYDLTTPIDTSLLWFFEGVTSYYDDLMLYRVGILDQAHYLEQLERHIDHIARQRGQHEQTVVEAGFFAWTKYYQPSENAANAHVSYYTKGALIAWCIDLFIRHYSGNRHSLDDVMRLLWRDFGQNFYQTDTPRGVTIGDIQQAIEQCAGTSAYHLLHIALFTKQPLPINLLLLPHGWHLKHQTAAPEFGAQMHKTDDGWLIGAVKTNSVAERAGLAPQDTLVALNRFKLTQKPDQILAEYPADIPLSIDYWREGVLHTTTLPQRLPHREAGHFHLHRHDDTATRWFDVISSTMPSP